MKEGGLQRGDSRERETERNGVRQKGRHGDISKLQRQRKSRNYWRVRQWTPREALFWSAQ